MPTITLDRNTVVADTPLPAGKTGEFYWDTITKGLGVRVRLGKNGKLQRSFVVQYRVGTQQRRKKLKVKLPDVDTARAKAITMFSNVDEGIDPAEKAAEATALKFSAGVEQYLDLKKLKIRPSSLRLTTLYLTGAYFEKLHRKPLAKVTRSDISTALDAIYVDSGAPTAGQAQKHLKAFFQWALRRGHVPTNPVHNTEPIKAGPGRKRVLKDHELAAVWHACKDDDLGRVIKLLVLTGCRCDEIGKLKWGSEVDLERGTIIIPGERAKNHREHTLPITAMMREVIESIPQRVNRDYLFGSRASGFTSWNGKATLGDGINEPWTLHDLRRSVVTGMAELGVEPHIIEACVNHISGHKGGIAGIYNRAKYEPQMRTALNVWSDHVRSIVDGTEQKVVALGSR